MDKTFGWLTFITAIIVGGIVYLHFKGSKGNSAAPTAADNLPVDRTTPDPSNMYVQFYGSGNGQWIPGGAMQIELPDPFQNDAGGNGSTSQFYNILTTVSS